MVKIGYLLAVAKVDVTEIVEINRRRGEVLLYECDSGEDRRDEVLTGCSHKHQLIRRTP